MPAMTKSLVAPLVLVCSCSAPQQKIVAPQQIAAPAVDQEPPKSPDLRAKFDEAVKLRGDGDPGAAKAKLDDVLASSPTFALAALERAELLVQLGTDAELAARDAQLAATQLPNNPRALKVF